MLSDPRQILWEALAYRTSELVLVHPLAIVGPPGGQRFPMEPIVSLPLSCDPTDLGAAARRVIDRSIIDAEIPHNLDELLDGVVTAAGFSSRYQFVQSSTCCSLTKRTDLAVLEIVPSRNGTGTQIEDGEVRYAILDRSVKLALDVSDYDLGEALSKSFATCE